MARGGLVERFLKDSILLDFYFGFATIETISLRAIEGDLKMVQSVKLIAGIRKSSPTRELLLSCQRC